MIRISCLAVLLAFYISSTLVAQKMTVKDIDDNVLMEVNDEGTVGSITLSDTTVAPSVITNKLYVLNGMLYWNGTALGTAGSAGGWTRTGTNVHLTTLTDFVGIGTSTPSTELDIRGSNTDDGGGMQVANSDESHWLYLLSGRLNSPNPLISWSDGGELRLGSYSTTFNERMRFASNGNVGIGLNTPVYPLDVDSTIGIDNTQVLYLPDQTKFSGSLIVGNGGISLEHTTGDEGQGNSALGKWALYYNTRGYRNTALGNNALYYNTTGNYNTASGFQALYSNDTASNNTAHGYAALRANTIGYQNTAVGSFALQANTEGNFNTACGDNALHSNTTGTWNTAIGTQALRSNTSGIYNTASGMNALYSNTTGTNNTASGYGALKANTSGVANTASGYQALFNNNTGSYNTAIGYRVNSLNLSGSANTLIGYEAGRGASTHSKSGNIFIGYQAGYNETGDSLLYIENTNSSTPLIGGNFAADEIYLNGKVGIGTTSPSEKLEVEGTIYSTTGGYKFPDGTLQTTAVTVGGGNTLDQAYDQGGPGAGRTIAADAGAVHITGPTGLTTTGWVGIRTTTPEFPLHVRGEFKLEGADFIMVDSSRGDGGRAMVHYGSGTGTDDKLVLNWAGDFEEGVTVNGSKLVVDGNLGIGTTNPNHKLDVVGDVHINGNLTWTEKTGYWSEVYRARKQDWWDYSYVTNLQLPHGATLTKLSFTWADSTASADHDITILRTKVNEIYPNVIMARAWTNGSSAILTSSYATPVSDPIIDNENWTYELVLDPTPAGIYIHSAVIEYTFEESY